MTGSLEHTDLILLSVFRPKLCRLYHFVQQVFWPAHTSCKRLRRWSTRLDGRNAWYFSMRALEGVGGGELTVFVIRGQLKYDGTRAETGFRLSAKRTSPFKSAWASVQSTTGSRGVRISGSNAGYTMFRGSVMGTGYPLHSPVSPSLPLPCVTMYHHISAEVYNCNAWLAALQCCNSPVGVGMSVLPLSCNKLWTDMRGLTEICQHIEILDTAQ